MSAHGPILTLDQATEIARTLSHWIGPSARLVKAGSLRRGKPKMHDVDVVGVIGAGDTNPLTFFVRVMHQEAPWTVENKDPSITTKLYKLAWNPDTRYPGARLDLFMCRPEAFGWIHLLRTGPEEFGKELVQIVRPWGFRFFEGRLCKITPAAGLIGSKDEAVPIDTPTEESVFEALGLPFLPMDRRHPAYLREVAANRVSK